VPPSVSQVPLLLHCRRGPTVALGYPLPLPPPIRYHQDPIDASLPLSVSQGPLLLHCSRGPKSLVALGYLLNELPSGTRVYAVDGGATAWEDANLPLEMVCRPKGGC